MTTEQTICPKCGKPRKNQAHGSFTQWIFDQNSCSCDGIGQLSVAHQTTGQFCNKCGRPTNAVRDGSMTQWIFRSVACRCGQGEIEQASEPVPEVDDQEELKLDADNFPIDRYKPLVELGAGSSGKVYMCTDRLLKKRVAVKTLRMLTNEQFVAFQTEARATSKLNHPAILKLLDFGPTACGAPYMVLEYFDSMTLEDFLREHGVLDPYWLQQIFMQIASALSLAHGMEIFHRDLKPANILVSRAEGNELAVKLIDFGTATLKLSDEAPLVVQGTTLVGTPAYMPPDTASGRPFDARSEIYSLGCLLFECLTGRLPFDSENPLELLSLHASMQPPSLADAGFQYGEDLEDLVARCLEKDPAARFASMSELSEALAQIYVSPPGEPEAESDEPLFPLQAQPADDSLDRTPWWILPAVLLLASGMLAFLAWFFLRQSDSILESSAPVSFEVDRFHCTKPEKPENFGDAQMKQLSGRQIKRLNLDGTHITEMGLQNLVGEPIEFLTLRATTLDWDKALSTLGKIKTLNRLHLDNNKIRSLQLSKLRGPNLRVLHLTGNPDIDDRALPILVRLFPGLVSLGIGRTGITEAGMHHLAGFKKLKSLEISSLPVRDSSLEVLLDLPITLVEAGLSEINDRGLLILARCPTLKEIKLLGCINVSQEGLREFQRRRPKIRVVIDKPELPTSF